MTMHTDTEHDEYLQRALDHADATFDIAEGLAAEMVTETWDGDPEDPEFLACRWNLNLIRDDERGSVSDTLMDAGYTRDDAGMWRKRSNASDK